MPKPSFEPSEFGIALTKVDFDEQMSRAFAERLGNRRSLDELLLHPREAIEFCDHVRARFGYFQLPDHVILRSLMTRRKSPPD